jgi:hypothetical protein
MLGYLTYTAAARWPDQLLGRPTIRRLAAFIPNNAGAWTPATGTGVRHGWGLRPITAPEDTIFDLALLTKSGGVACRHELTSLQAERLKAARSVGSRESSSSQPTASHAL